MAIRKVAVLGAGVMGQGIAAHLANAGVPSLLFDIPPREGADPRALAKAGIANIGKLKPAALFRAADTAMIAPCEYEADKARLAECDLVIEVVAEVLAIKKRVYAWVAENRRSDAIVASNTSGIPIAAMSAGMDEALRRRFMITHFFNPVRYMQLLELVAGPDTDPAVVAELAAWGERTLGKGIVFARDTPAFVANRIGTFGMVSIFRHMGAEGLGVEAVDAIFGKAMGRPDSAVFRTADLVGLDTLAHVIRGIHDACPADERRADFTVPPYVEALIAAGALGEKSGAGFYKKVKNAEGKSEILALDLAAQEYRPASKPRFDSLGAAKRQDNVADGVKALLAGNDAAARVAWAVTADVLIYAANRVGEIASDIVNIDRAMKWGFRWEQGPFETWDALGVAPTVARMEGEGRVVPTWVKDMLASGRTAFYGREGAARSYWSGGPRPVPESREHVYLADLKAAGREVESNASASLVDLGEGVLCLEFHSKMNALDDLIFPLYARALDRLDAGEFEALVVGNQGGNAFCAGANLLMILMGAMQGDWNALDGAIRTMQGLLSRAKYSARPVVTAPWGLTLGGGVEVTMQSAATRAGGELYAGLVEVGVGLIPAGGGCKEMLARYLGDVPGGANVDPNPLVQRAFEQIGMAKVATSAEEAREAGFLRPGDGVTMDPDRLIHDAWQTALGLARSGYRAPRPKTFKLPGPSGRAAIEAFLYSMRLGGHISAHDERIGRKLAHVLCGGDCPSGAVRTEQDILDLEREAFLSLCGTPETMARIQHMLEKGKPLRN